MDELKQTIHDKVKSCTNCILRESATAPVPFAGDRKSVYVAVGEAPGAKEDEEGVPFIGAAGGVLRGGLKEVGAPVNRVAFVNTVCCRPPNNRTPSNAEVTACNSNLVMQLSYLSRAKIIWLMGNTAISAFRPDFKVSWDRGRPFLWKDRIIIPTYHPAAVGRGGKSIYAEFIDDLSQGRWRLRNGISTERWPTDCRVCNGEGTREDDQRVIYCEAHYGQGKKRGSQMGIEGVV